MGVLVGQTYYHVEIQTLLIGYQIVLANEFLKSNLLF